MQDMAKQGPGPETPSLYDSDFYSWANQQAALLRAGRLSEADIANIAEEIESMGKTEKRELVSRLAVLLMHLLKWRYQQGKRTKSWRVTIRGQRIELTDHLGENPGLKATMEESMRLAYRRARNDATLETALEIEDLPEICPWSYDEIIDDAFWPEA